MVRTDEQANRCLNISKEHYSFLRHRSLTYFFFIYKANKPCGITEASGGVRKSSTLRHHVIGALRNDDERTRERRRSCKKKHDKSFPSCCQENIPESIVLFLSPAMGVMTAIATLSLPLIGLNQTSNHPE